ncbi:MAG: hypothetical protein KA928_00850 [Longilinea sp.]|nr:hypothetical protein [Longilinea sp.]
MKIKRVTRLLIFTVICLVLGGCTTPAITEAPVEDLNKSQFAIQTNTQLTFQTLKIGVGNIWPEDYLTRDGETVNGLTAALWLFVEDKSDLDQTVRVHPGMTLEIDAYLINIVDVREDGVILEFVSQ